MPPPPGLPPPLDGLPPIAPRHAKLLVLERANIDKEAFLRGLKPHIYAGDLDKAISYCAGQKRTPLVSVTRVGISARKLTRMTRRELCRGKLSMMMT